MSRKYNSEGSLAIWIDHKNDLYRVMVRFKDNGIAHLIEGEWESEADAKQRAAEVAKGYKELLEQLFSDGELTIAERRFNESNDNSTRA